MIIIYKYHAATHAYCYSKQIDDDAEMPINTTIIAPCDCTSGYVAIFDVDLQTWSLQEDHVGECGYVDGVYTVIESFGPLPYGWSTESPESDCCVWLGGKWCRGVEATIMCLESKRDELLAAGYTDSLGNTFQIRESPDDLKNFALIRDMLNSGFSSAHGGFWRTIDNRMVAKTDVEMLDLSMKAPYHAASIRRAYSNHVDTVNALTDAQAALYDIDTGWPTNG